MSSGTFSAEISVDNIAALKAIANPPDKATRYARDTSPAGDLSREAGWYTFRFGDSTAEDLPDIVAPTTGNGRWRSFVGGDVGGGGGGVAVEGQPNRAPEFVGETWTVLAEDSITEEVTAAELWIGVFISGSLASGPEVINVGGGAWREIQLA